MSSNALHADERYVPAPVLAARWYAIQTMSRHERVVACQLEGRGMKIFLPTITEVHRWSDRNRKVELPLFSGYLFAHITMSPQVRGAVSCTRGAAGFIMMGGEPVAIPEEEIESVQRVLSSNVGCISYPFLKVGRRVRIRGGALDGLQGILQAHDGYKGLVISIDGIQRSLAVRIEGYQVEVV